MSYFLHILSWILLIPVIFSAGYLFLFALGGKFSGTRKGKTSRDFPLKQRIALLVPAYKEDAVILDTVHNLLSQAYESEYWDLVVIADSLRWETLEALRALPICLVEVSFEESTKAKALNEAMKRLPETYDIAVILDADNIVEPLFLRDIQRHWKTSTQALQCHRTAKNTQTSTAVLDAISEEVANHIFCLGHRSLGLSSRLVGSGMAFDYGLFKRIMGGINAVGGFDKELELKLLREEVEIEYLPHIKVYDEKVSKPQTMQKQRLRWIAAQFHYLKVYISPAIRDFFIKGNKDFLDKSLQMMLMPRLMLIGLSSLGALISWVIGSPLQVLAWNLSFAMVFFAYLLGTPPRFFSWQSIKALMSLPKAIFLMLLGMGDLKTANKKFIHTPHGELPVNQRVEP